MCSKFQEACYVFYLHMQSPRILTTFFYCFPFSERALNRVIHYVARGMDIVMSLE